MRRARRNRPKWLSILCFVVIWNSPSLVQSADNTSAIPATQPGPSPVNPADSILSEYTPEVPPNPKPPPYTMLRFNEDYHCLANPENRTDPLDVLKYIPLNPDDSYSYLSLGGEIRERYEHYQDIGFGTHGSPERDDYLLQRITLDADFHLNANVRFFVQGISGLQFGGTGSTAPVNQDPVDLQQAFGDLKLADSPDSPNYLIIRGGRFEMSYGSGRLVATRAAPNIPFKFDGLQLIDSIDGAKIYAFITKPAREQKYEFDDEYPDQLFWGVYGTTPTLVQSLGLKADLYYLGYKNDQAIYAAGSGDEERHTFGTRLFGKTHGFDYDIEPIFQTGRFADQDIFAWTVGSSVGYRFENVTAKPRLGVNFDVVSGDTHDGLFGTFNPLYFKAGYFDDASVIRPSNIIDIHPTIEFLPLNNLLVVFGSDVLWRYSTSDGVYGPAGNIEIPSGGSSRYIATTAEFSTQWQVNRHLTWIASYAHLFTSDTVHELGGKDVDFFGTWLTFTW
jgi:hypothetical protein